LAAPAAAARPGASAAAPAWGTAQELPGIAALDDGGVTIGASLSCSSPGNCAVGGSYYGPTVGSGASAYVADQRNGTWGKAIEVPGLAALNAGKFALVGSISCTSAGDCTAGGGYSPGAPDLGFDAFVVTERDGIWGKAIEVPGTGALNAGPTADVSSVSCWSPGDCTAAGQYEPGGVASQGIIDTQAFVVTEKNGTWGSATELPGLAALSTGKQAAADAISCTAGGSCAVGGSYTTASGRQQAFVADESAGTWQPAEEVPGTGSLNVDGEAGVSDVSCASPGNCGATGYDSGNSEQSFVASEVNGTWRTADALPDDANAGAISCPSAGNCLAGGSYYTGVTGTQAFVMSERSGTWGKLQPVPGLAGLNVGQAAGIQSVSCSAAGDCAAGGTYAATKPFLDQGPPPTDQAFVVAETDGTWGRAHEVPGSPAQPPTTADVSCVSPQSCAAAVSYGAGGVVVVSTETPTATTESLSASTVTYGREQAERVSVAVTAKTGGPPAGTVTVKAGSGTLCVITLGSGAGSCKLTARMLQPGTYRVTAAYPGSPDFTNSVSPAKTLTVVK
jgi:hypothetical protein